MFCPSPHFYRFRILLSFESLCEGVGLAASPLSLPGIVSHWDGPFPEDPRGFSWFSPETMDKQVTVWCSLADDGLVFIREVMKSDFRFFCFHILNREITQLQVTDYSRNIYQSRPWKESFGWTITEWYPTNYYNNFQESSNFESIQTPNFYYIVFPCIWWHRIT